MSQQSQSPIGIFDSGIGGLTVARAIMEALPGESLIYFGDTAHLPYGDKSTAAIQAYSIKITDVLLQAGSKAIVIACNSASSAAYELVKAYVGSRAEVVNVIDPIVSYLREHHAGQSIGLIGTRQTIGSGVFEKKINDQQADIRVCALATPLLAPMIEDGFCNNHVSQSVISQYLSHSTLAGIEAIVLGCTHYPIIRKEIEAYYQHRIPALDSGRVVAQTLKNILEIKQLLNKNSEVRHRFLVSDLTISFQESTRLFFGQSVNLELYPLWE